MNIKYFWKILSEDGLLKDPPKFKDYYNYEYDVNINEDWELLESEEQAYNNIKRVREETNDDSMKYFEFVLLKIVKVY